MSFPVPGTRLPRTLGAGTASRQARRVRPSRVGPSPPAAPAGDCPASSTAADGAIPCIPAGGTRPWDIASGSRAGPHRPRRPRWPGTGSSVRAEMAAGVRRRM